MVQVLAISVALVALAALVAVDVPHRRAGRRLKELALTDDLTGLPNRRAWRQALAREMARARRDRKPLSVVMIDLDHFKRFNDRYGHAAGDRLLQGWATGAMKRLRASA